MNYDEELPSFKHIRPIILWNSGEYTIEKDVSRPDDTAFKVKDIIIHTIDKQRVKEVLDYWIGSIDDRIIRIIKKQLGLED